MMTLDRDTTAAAPRAISAMPFARHRNDAIEGEGHDGSCAVNNLAERGWPHDNELP